MSTRVRIAFTACPPRAEVVRRVAPRFAAVADVRVYACLPDSVEAVVPTIREDEPHVVVADPKAVAHLADHLGTTVVPFEFTVDVLTARVNEARRETARVGVVVTAGSVNPAVVRLLEWTVGRVPIFFWDDDAHRRDLLTRCRRMGIRAIIGGMSTADLAAREGMTGLCLYDRPEETDGVISQMIFTAAMLGIPKVAARGAERIALGFVLDKICAGVIGQHDTVLHVDAHGLVIAVLACRREGAGESPGPETILAGIPRHETLGMSICKLSARQQDGPLHLDVYPLPQASGYIAVVRDERRREASPGSNGPRN